MPKLTGSAKQVSWAETIRSDAIANAGYIARDAGREIGLYGPNGTKITPQAAKVVRSEIMETLQKTESASTLIDNRSRLSYNSILRLAELETRTGQVSEARRRRQ